MAVADSALKGGRELCPGWSSSMAAGADGFVECTGASRDQGL